jgi:hypothetical protein
MFCCVVHSTNHLNLFGAQKEIGRLLCFGTFRPFFQGCGLLVNLYVILDAKKYAKNTQKTWGKTTFFAGAPVVENMTRNTSKTFIANIIRIDIKLIQR